MRNQSWYHPHSSPLYSDFFIEKINLIYKYTRALTLRIWFVGTHSRVPYTVTFYTKSTRALTFEIFFLLWFLGVQVASTLLFLWSRLDKIVVVDIDGTIT